MTHNPIAAASALIGQIIACLLIVSAFGVFILGVKPKPCPRHICFPRNEVVTVEQMIQSDPGRFDPDRPRATAP